MKKSLLYMVMIMLSACSPTSPATTTTDQESPNLAQTEDKTPTQSKYYPYTEEQVKAKLKIMQTFVDQGYLHWPAEVKEAQSYIDRWDKYPDMLKLMMESDLDPANTTADQETEQEDVQLENLNVRARITSRESESAFNVPGAIEYMLELQSADEQDFVLQGLKINRGRCGFYTGDFRSKLPVTMRYSSTASYLLKCRGDQVLEVELITDQGNFNLSF